MCLPVLRARRLPPPHLVPTGATRASARARPDAAGDARPRAHQLRPADQLLARLARVRVRRRARSTAAFRLYMLPAGHLQRGGGDRAVPVALAPRRAPRLRRPAARARANGVRQIAMLLIPRRGDHRGARRAAHAARLPARRVRRRSRPTRSRTALFWFASRCRSAAPTCCSRARSSRSSARGSRPRLAVGLAGRQRRRLARAYKPLGIAGIVIGTAVASAAMAVAQTSSCAAQLHGFEIGADARGRGGHPRRRGAARSRRLRGLGRPGLALGRSLLAQLVSVGCGHAARAACVYAVAVIALRDSGGAADHRPHRAARE